MRISWFFNVFVGVVGGSNYSTMANLGFRTYWNTLFSICGTYKSVTKSGPSDSCLLQKYFKTEENLTYFPHNINEMPETKDVIEFYKNIHKSYPGNEIVFHDGISTELISKIWVKNKDITPLKISLGIKMS